MEKAAVSVIIPAYNRSGLIGQTLQSLLNQTLPADEIIVVDDGSSDGTEEAAWAAFHRWESGKVKGGKFAEFKVIRQDNAGPGAARNRGFAESKSEFIHFFDSDDIAAANKHEVQVRALQETGADIAYGPWVKGYIRERGAWSREQGATSEVKRDQEEQGARSGEQGGQCCSFEPEGHVLQQKGLPKGDLIKELLTRWSVVPQACLFRRSIVEKSGGFPDDMFIAEDQLMFLRCLLVGAKAVHTPDTLTFYRLGDSGKLTESSAAGCRRVADWSLFLRRAREECQAIGIDPARWLGFRRRIWGAYRLPGQHGHSVQSEATPKVDLSSRVFYTTLATAERWIGGVKARLAGHRQNASFRCGSMTCSQTNLFPDRL